MNKFVAILLLLIFFSSCIQKPKTMENLWPSDVERYWVGPQFLSVPETDWKLDSGRLVCVKPGQNKGVVMLTRTIEKPMEGFELSFEGGFLMDSLTGAGRMGVVLSLNDETDFTKGLFAGVTSGGQLQLASVKSKIKPLVPGEKLIFDVEGTPLENGLLHLLLRVRNENSDTQLGELTADVKPEKVKGLVALFCDKEGNGADGDVVWFESLEITGAAIAGFPEKARGPILKVSYGFDGNNLKMTVQVARVVLDGDRKVVLQIRDKGEWETIAQQPVDSSYLVTFNIKNIKKTDGLSFRVYTRFVDRFGSLKYHYVTGSFDQ